MVTMLKENRLLNVLEDQKAEYLQKGYDVVELAGGEYQVVERATGGKSYTVAEYRKAVDDLEVFKEGYLRLEDEVKGLRGLVEKHELEKANLRKEIAALKKTPAK
ncbi:MAG: hypothetical protein FWF59_08470 [Turicibacter sp.]|nr:hypothetical protein [Turicibacter sp.]